MGQPVVFIALALVAILSAFGMLLSHNAVHAALFLVLNFITIGVFYIVLAAPFIAMVQITVYAGAIMVLFLFVIMLLGAERLEGAQNVPNTAWQRPLAVFLAAVLVLAFGYLIIQEAVSATGTALPPLDSSPQAIGELLFGSYIFPFEVTAVLLLVSMISLVVWKAQDKRG
ncbi:MAG: NADH-quinone oxidoreductase subunit J [Anaerolineae bacterium]|nr:NADH-quinone oxidoreductase subunit J [Anaerolineae bacterium]MCO5194813.1 NADH-quinone oxidoreductase subunit J [Anaerolineae bacterium]MCO5203760.1 NADH-quinone oxidoreductase subunit J [Anaerolineae bacterium]